MCCSFTSPHAGSQADVLGSVAKIWWFKNWGRSPLLSFVIFHVLADEPIIGRSAGRLQLCSEGIRERLVLAAKHFLWFCSETQSLRSLVYSGLKLVSEFRGRQYGL